MKRLLSLAALALAGAALAQKPADKPADAHAPKPTATPSPCAFTAGLEIGQTRAAAFEVMRFSAPELKAQNVKTYHHAPAKRPYAVDVTFSSDAPDAHVVLLKYAYEPSGVFDALRERYGEPEAKQPAPGSWRWQPAKCPIVVTYHAKEDDHHQVVGEELTVEPAAPKAK